MAEDRKSEDFVYSHFHLLFFEVVPDISFPFIEQGIQDASRTEGDLSH